MTKDEHYLIRVMFDMYPQEFSTIRNMFVIPAPLWEVSFMLGITFELLHTKATPPTQATEFADGV